MNFKIHRGTNEIGGSCVEVWTENTGIVIDLGLPLVNPDKTQFNSSELKGKSTADLIKSEILPSIPGLDDGKYEILISHAHQDHYGLLGYYSQKCKVHLGKATHEIIKLSGVFTPSKTSIPNSVYFESGKKFKINDITITPYLMDHSAFDAYAFLIQADGKSLFYSGDFRTHGRKGKAFEWFKKTIKISVDYLLLEGTTVGNNSHQSVTETELEANFIEIFKKTQGINVVYTSGQNIDRLVTIFRACRRTGKKMVIDFYIASVLKVLKDFASIPYTSDKFNELSVFFPKFLCNKAKKNGNEKYMNQFRDYKCDKDTIKQDYKDIVILMRPSMIGFNKVVKDIGEGSFIYSMWKGYLRDIKTAEFIKTFKSAGFNYEYVHTSGHADSKALQDMVDATNPKYIVPIHTFAKDQYASLFPSRTIKMVNDGDVISV